MKNMHGIEIRPPQERIAELRLQITQALAELAEVNACDADTDRTCVALSTLHGLFSRKHVVMRQVNCSRQDLDRYAQREERDALA
jgi:hypothetical protein